MRNFFKDCLRYLVTAVWGAIFMSIIGFIAAALTQRQYDPPRSLIIGAVFGLLFAVIIPTITAHSHKDKSKYSKS